jgi:acyl carrier protein
MENKIEERIKNVMSSVFELPIEQIKDSSSPDTIESWDSLKHMNLVIALEDEFNCEFTDSETVEIVNYKLILTIIAEHIVADN